MFKLSPIFLVIVLNGSIFAQAHGSPASVTVNAAAVGAATNRLILGANEGVTTDFRPSNIPASLASMGMAQARYPEGGNADTFHFCGSTWPTTCSSSSERFGIRSCANSNYIGSPGPLTLDFPTFLADVVNVIPLTPSVVVNYGSNYACTDGGDPTEAAAWVAYADTTNNYAITYWTVGNEQYASTAVDLRANPRSASEYASFFNTYQSDMKAATSFPIKVCADINPKQGGVGNWDVVMLAGAHPDCVDFHYYAESAGNESDSFLLSAPAAFTGYINTENARLAAAGDAGVPIIVSEAGSVPNNVGNQTQSIVNALFYGQMVGEAENDGVALMSWHTANPQQCSTTGNNTNYGWQNYGDAGIIGDGRTSQCSEAPPAGTVLAVGNAMSVAAQFVCPGPGNMLGVSVTGNPNVTGYADKCGDGSYRVMLFNRDEFYSANASIGISDQASGAGGTVYTYDKAIYDATQVCCINWNPYTSAALGEWHHNISVDLSPWSMSVFVFPANHPLHRLPLTALGVFVETRIMRFGLERRRNGHTIAVLRE